MKKKIKRSGFWNHENHRECGFRVFRTWWVSTKTVFKTHIQTQPKLLSSCYEKNAINGRHVRELFFSYREFVCLWGGGQTFLGWSKGPKGDQIFFRVKQGEPKYFCASTAPSIVCVKGMYAGPSIGPIRSIRSSTPGGQNFFKRPNGEGADFSPVGKGGGQTFLCMQRGDQITLVPSHHKQTAPSR